MGTTFAEIKKMLEDGGALGYSSFILDYYKDFVTIEEAFEQNIIPSKYKPIIPTKCACGSEFIIKRNRKVMQCCDPHCPEKIARAMAHMFHNYGIKGIDYSTCRLITDWCIQNKVMEVPTHTEVLKIDCDSNLCYVLGARWDILCDAICTIKTANLTLPGLIRNACIPDFGTSATKFFNGVNSFNQMVNVILDGKLRDYFVSKGVYSLKKFSNFFFHIPTIINAETLRVVPLMQQGSYNRGICITGPVYVNNVHTPRSEFIQLCNEIARDKEGNQLLSFHECKAIASVDCVIADAPSSSRTYLKARDREEREGIKLIITAQDYVDNLKREVEECLAMTN